MKHSILRGLFLIVILVGGVAGLSFGQTRVHVTGEAVASFQRQPSAGDVIASFTTSRQPLYWGIGYEIVFRHLGFGGVYAVDFTQNSTDEWWFDWYGEAFYLSYHLFGHRTLVDPFVTVGLGSAGRVYLGPAPVSSPAQPTLLLSLFPVVSGGLGLDLSGLYLSLKLSYLPVVSPPPATSFEVVPVGHFLAVASAGVTFGR